MIARECTVNMGSPTVELKLYDDIISNRCERCFKSSENEILNLHYHFSYNSNIKIGRINLGSNATMNMIFLSLQDPKNIEESTASDLMDLIIWKNQLIDQGRLPSTAKVQLMNRLL